MPIQQPKLFTLIQKVMLYAFVLIFSTTPVTNAAFSSQEQVANNTVSAARWDAETLAAETEKVEEEKDNLTLDASFDSSTASVVLRLSGSDLALYTNATYLITYTTASSVEQGMSGELTIPPDTTELSSEPLVLGTCSESVCTLDAGVTQVHIVVTLQGTTEKTISQDLQI